MKRRGHIWLAIVASLRQKAAVNRATRCWLSIGVAVLAAVTTNPRVHATAGYTVVDLGDFGGGTSFGYDINNSGQVTGYASDSGNLYWAFLYSNGVLTNLGAPNGYNPDGTPAYGGTSSRGWAINAFGDVTGMYLYCPFNVICQPTQHPFLYSNGSIVDIGSGFSGAGAAINGAGDVTGGLNVTGGSHAFLYSGGVTKDLGALPNLPYATAAALNTSGQVVGWSTKPYPNYLPHAFLYSNNAMTDVTPGGGDAWAINDSGQMTGFYYTSGGIWYHAYVYDTVTGRLTDLGTLNGDSAASRAFAINAAGQVAGTSDVPSGASHAFLYSSGTMIDLGALGGSQSWPGNDFYNHSINVNGQVVGTSYLPGDSQTHAFLYSDGVMTDLNSLIPADSGWTLQVANAINDSGQITGYGLINGMRHAFLLTPATATPSLRSIAVTPVNPSTPVGTTQAFVATGSYTDGSTQNLTGSVTWASAMPTVATIDAGVATAVGAGTSTISATLTGVTGSTVLTVMRAGTTTSLASSQNPSTVGQTVTLTATVLGFHPSGVVTFKDGVAVLGTASLNAAGVAALQTSALAIGSHSITAGYGGDGNNVASASGMLTQTINLSPTTTSLTSSPNPSIVHQGVTVTVTVSGYMPTGTVTFQDSLASLGSVTLTAGTATVVFTGLTPGSHALNALYSGDANNLPSVASLTQWVATGSGKVPTTTTLTVSSTTISVGQPVTLTATVNGAAPTGTVTFMDVNTLLGTAALNAGVATLTTTTLTRGAHQITATYNGDATNLPSSSPNVKVQAQ